MCVCVHVCVMDTPVVVIFAAASLLLMITDCCIDNVCLRRFFKLFWLNWSSRLQVSCDASGQARRCGSAVSSSAGIQGGKTTKWCRILMQIVIAEHLMAASDTDTFPPLPVVARYC